MKVIYAPIVSSVSGRFGGLVFSNWRSVSLVRRFRKPANPKSTDQGYVRNIFRNSNISWIRQSPNVRAAWVASAVGKDFTGRNHYIGKQVPVLNDQTDLDNLVGTPDDASTLAPTSLVLTPGVNEIVATVTPPSIPTGWSITKVHAYAIPDADWSSAVFANAHKEAEAAAGPWECTIALFAIVLHQVRGYIEWLAPDGTTRWSTSLADSNTPTTP